MDDDDNGTLSSHSSLSELSHAETIEPTTEGKIIVRIRKEKHNLKYFKKHYSIDRI